MFHLITREYFRFYKKWSSLSSAYACNHEHIRQIRLLVNPFSYPLQSNKTNLIIVVRERIGIDHLNSERHYIQKC